MKRRSAHNAPGIMAAVARRTPAFASGGRPAPSSVLGQLWAALTRNTPAFAGAAQRAERRQSSEAASRPHAWVSANTFSGGASVIVGHSEQIVNIPSAERGVAFPDSSLQALTRAIEKLTAQVSQLSMREADLMSSTVELLGAISHLGRQADESVTRISMLLGAADDLSARCRELAEQIRQLAPSGENPGLEAAQRAQRQLKIARRLLDVVPILARDLEPTSDAAEDTPENIEGQPPRTAAGSAESNRVNVHRDRGLVLRDLGRLEEALTAFDQALALEPDNFATHRDRGLVLRDLGRLEEALTAFDQALAAEVGNIEVRDGDNDSG